MGVDHYAESGCLLLAESLFTAELEHATARGKLSDPARSRQRAAARRLLEDDPGRKQILQRMIEVCGKSRQDLEAIGTWEARQPWVGDGILASVAETANTILGRFGISPLSGADVVSHFVDPDQGFDDFPNQPLQLYLWLPPDELWTAKGKPKRPTVLLCGYLGLRPDVLRETSWVRISF